MCNNLLDCYKYPPPTQRRKAVLWIRSRSEALPGKAWDSDQHRQPEQGNLPPTTESRWSQRKPAATWLTLSLPPGRTVSSGSIKIVQSKDPYACKTYACKTPSNQSVSSFMESIKDKSSLKILVVMIWVYICCVLFRYCLGVIPYFFLKAVWKWAWLE